MLIATYFRRPKAPIELRLDDGKFQTYFFTPIDPTNPESEHVAEVTNPAHITRLLQIPEGYYIAHANTLVEAAGTAAARIAKPGGASEPPVVNAAPAAVDDSVAASAPQAEPVAAAQDSAVLEAATQAPPPADDTTAANALLAMGLGNFKGALRTTPAAVLRAAVEIEAARGADERATYTKALREQLSRVAA